MRTNILLLTLFIASSCATQKDLATKNLYTFEYEGDSFQITSINTESGEGTNFINQLDEEGRITRKARDIDQDGTIDLILKGNWTLITANLIYNEGIKSAKAAGNFTERTTLRTFEHQTEEYVLTVKSYSNGENHIYNMFIIQNRLTKDDFIFLDSEADGKLDIVEKGNFELDPASELYRQTLLIGIERNRIEFLNNIYIVIKTSELLTYQKS